MYKNLTSFVPSFKQKLLAVNIDNIASDILVKNYLQSVFEQQDYYIKIYCWVLENALSKTNKQIHQISFLDFGCGNGLFAIFAKHCGFGKVYGCDFNENFVAAARLLASAMNVEVDDWFVCNENDLPKKCNNLQLDIVAGTDVIEHIYNLNIFFSNIRLLNNKMITTFTTASVYENYFKRKNLYKLMHKDENIGSNILEATSKDEYAGLAYFEIRKLIIQKQFPQLKQEAVLQLATATKGLRKEDIVELVNTYLQDRAIKNIQQNDHNTCDPITGNFTERVLQIKDYKLLYNQNNFVLQVKSGFYSATGNGLKSFIQKCLNKVIIIFKNTLFSRSVSPLILLIGVPKTSN